MKPILTSTQSARGLLLAATLGAALLAAPALHAGPHWGSEGHGGLSPWGHALGWERGAGPMAGKRNPQARVERKLNRMRTELQLQPAQEAAWSAFASAAQAQTQAMQQARQQLGAPAATLPERIEQGQRLAAARTQGQQQVQQALLNLYQTLTPQQRAVLDRKGMGRRD